MEANSSEMDDLELDFLQKDRTPTIVNGTEEKSDSEAPQSSPFDANTFDFELNSTTTNRNENSTTTSTFTSNTEVDDIFGSSSIDSATQEVSITNSPKGSSIALAIDDPFGEFDPVSKPNTTASVPGSDNFDDFLMNGNINTVDPTTVVNEHNSSSFLEQEDDVFGSTQTETESILPPVVSTVDTNQLLSFSTVTEPVTTSNLELGGIRNAEGEASSMFDVLDLGGSISTSNLESTIQEDTVSVPDTPDQLAVSEAEASIVSAVATSVDDDILSQSSELYVPPTFTSSSSRGPFGDPVSNTENSDMSSDTSDPFGDFGTTIPSNISETKNDDPFGDEMPSQPTDISSFVEASEPEAILLEPSVIEDTIQEKVAGQNEPPTMDFAAKDLSSLLETTSSNEEVAGSTNQVGLTSQYIDEFDSCLAPAFSSENTEEIFSSYNSIEETAPPSHESRLDPVDPIGIDVEPAFVESQVEVQATSEMTEISLATNAQKLEPEAEGSSDLTTDELNTSSSLTSSFHEEQVVVESAKTVETFGCESEAQQLPPHEEPCIEQQEDFVTESSTVPSNSHSSATAYGSESAAVDSSTASGFSFISTVASTTTTTSTSSTMDPYESTTGNSSEDQSDFSSFETIEDVPVGEGAICNDNDDPFGDFITASSVNSALETDLNSTSTNFVGFTSTTTVTDDAGTTTTVEPSYKDDDSGNNNSFGDFTVASTLSSTIETDSKSASADFEGFSSVTDVADDGSNAMISTLQAPLSSNDVLGEGGDFASAPVSSLLETDPSSTSGDFGDFSSTSTPAEDAGTGQITATHLAPKYNDEGGSENAFRDFAAATSVSNAIETDPHIASADFGDFGSTSTTILDDAATGSISSTNDFSDFGSSNVGETGEMGEERKDDFGDFSSGGSLQTVTRSMSDDFGDFSNAPTAANESVGITRQESDEFGDFGSAPATDESCAIERQSSNEFGGFSSAPAPAAEGFGLERQSSDEFGNFGSTSDFSSNNSGTSTSAFGDFQQSTTTSSFGDFESFADSTANSEATRQQPALSDGFGDFSTTSTSNTVAFEPSVSPAAPTAAFNVETPQVLDAEKLGLFFSKAFPVDPVQDDIVLNAFQNTTSVTSTSALEWSDDNNHDRIEKLSKAFGSLYLKAFDTSEADTKEQKPTTNSLDTRQQRIKQLKYVLKEKIQEAFQHSSVLAEGSAEYNMMNQLLGDTCEDEQLILKAIMNVQNLLLNHAVNEAMMRIAKQAAMSAKAKIAEMAAQQHSSTRASLLHPFHTTRQLLTSRSSDKDHAAASHGVLTPTGASMGKISRFSFNGTAGANGTSSTTTGSGSVSSEHEVSSGDECSGTESVRMDSSGYDSDPTSSVSSSSSENSKGGSGGFMKKFMTSLSGTRYKTQTRMVRLRRMGESGEEVRKMELNMEQISGGFDEVKWKCAQFVYDMEEVASLAPAQVRILSYPTNEVLSSKSDRGVLLRFLKPGTIWTVDIGKISDE